MLYNCYITGRDLIQRRAVSQNTTLHLIAKDELEGSLNVATGYLQRSSCQRLVSDTHVKQLL